MTKKEENSTTKIFVITITVIFFVILFIFLLVRYIIKKNTASPVYLHDNYIQTGYGSDPHLYLNKTGSAFTVNLHEAAVIEKIFVKSDTDNDYYNLVYYGDDGTLKQLKIIEDSAYHHECDYWDYLYDPQCWVEQEAGYYFKMVSVSKSGSSPNLETGSNALFISPKNEKSELVYVWEPKAGSTGTGDYIYLYNNNSAIAKKPSPATAL